MHSTNLPLNSTRTPLPVTGTAPGNTNTPFGATAIPFASTDASFRNTAAPFSSPNGRPPQQNGDFSFKELIELVSQAVLIIRAKWYWGLLGALLIAGPVGYLLLTSPITYTAETALLAQTTLDKVIGTDTDSGGSTEQSRENNLRNHLSMMTSRKFRARLAASFTDDEKRLIADPYKAVPDADFFQDFFEGSIAIERERGREYYTVTVTHRNADTAIMIADRFTAEYLNFVQQEYKDANLQGYVLLEKQAEAIRADIAKVESERLDFRKKNGIISRADNQSILTERLKRLDSSLTDIRVKRRGLETLTKQAQEDRAKSKYPWDNAYLAGFANNQDLRQDLDKQVAQRAVLASRYGPNHPKMRDIDSQIDAINSSIQRNFDVAVRDLLAQLDVATQNEKLLQKEFDDSFTSSIEIEKLASSYEILSAGVDSKKITLETLEKKIGEASVSSKLPADFMQIVDPAYLTKHRIPKRLLYGVAVVFLALGVFLASPLLASVLDERVSGRSDLEKVLGLGLVGSVPWLKLRPEDRAHVVRNRLDLVVAESFIGIVGQMEVGSAQRYPKVIMVTSTLPGEGKSLIASNLASTFQQLGKKTVLVDFDLRRPVQHRLHAINHDKGFVSWARAGFPVDAQLLEEGGNLGVRKLVDGTDLICAGGSEPQPSQFLVSEHMQILINRLRSAYDVVIIDTPPAGVFKDALILARFATERVLVAREGVAPTVQVKQVIDEFAKSEFAFQGVVLNGFNPRMVSKKLAYGYKGAAKGYAYHKSAGGSGKQPTPVSVPKPAVAMPKSVAAKT
jgi:capsular exopolysaccharide synthesis family protein